MNYIISSIARGEEPIPVPSDLTFGVSHWARHIQGRTQSDIQVGDVLTITPRDPEEGISYIPNWRVASATPDGYFTAKAVV